METEKRAFLDDGLLRRSGWLSLVFGHLGVPIDETKGDHRLVNRGGLVLLLVVLAVTRIGGNPVVEDGNGLAVEIAALTVPIVGTEPLITGPDQFLGVASPEPDFDTTDLGPDLSFAQRESELTPLDSDEVLRAVYLGHDTDGDPYYVWQSGSGNFLQLLGQIIADFGSFGRIETSYGSEIVGGDGDERPGVTAGSIEISTGSPATLTAEWHGLPPAVAAVVFYKGDDPIGWQRPVSGTVAIQYEFEAGEHPSADAVDMVALDMQGEEWNRIVLFPAEDAFEAPQQISRYRALTSC